MVFTSLPVYQFDPPNWQQMQQMNHQPGGCTHDQNPNPHFPPPLPPPPPPAALPPPQMAGAGHSSTQVRPNSMVERARQAKIPLPEAALKCPRCDSTNTKFCYFNNYSLTQPRHFCKTCRRYWTRGGALRNVPVGGGCRRNKRSKSNGGSSTRSKSTVVVAADHQQASNATTPPLSCHASYSNPSKLLNLDQIPSLPSNLPIFPPIQSLGDYSPSSNIGLDFGPGIQINNTSGMSSSGGLFDQWRSSLQQIQQFPFLIHTTGLEQSSNVLYPLIDSNEGCNQDQEVDFANQLRSKPLMEMAAAADAQSGGNNVKVEDNDHDGIVNNLSRNFLGNININSVNDQYTSWGGSSNSWNTTDLPAGFTSNNNPTSRLL